MREWKNMSMWMWRASGVAWRNLCVWWSWSAFGECVDGDAGGERVCDDRSCGGPCGGGAEWRVVDGMMAVLVKLFE